MITPNLISKSDIRLLISRGELPEAVDATLYYAEYCNAAEPANQLRVLSGRLNQHINNWATGQIAYEEFSREQARISYALTSWLEQLPNQPTPNAGKRKLLKEADFKKRLMLLLIVTKLVVLSRVWYHWSIGTFDTERLFAVFGLLSPMFVAYFSLIIGDYLRAHREGVAPVPRFVSGPLVSIAYWLFPIYMSLLLYVIKLGTTGQELTFTSMCTIISAIETVLGGYIGQVMAAFFKKD